MRAAFLVRGGVLLEGKGWGFFFEALFLVGEINELRSEVAAQLSFDALSFGHPVSSFLGFL